LATCLCRHTTEDVRRAVTHRLFPNRSRRHDSRTLSPHPRLSRGKIATIFRIML
jgi:hypothetical protein